MRVPLEVLTVMHEAREKERASAPRTIYYTASSLDGFLATEDHSLAWLLQFGNVPGGDYAEFIAGVGAVAMGANTYGWLLEHEVQPPGAEPRPWPYQQPTWVFSNRAQPQVTGADIRYAAGPVGPVHAEMLREARGRNVWIVGGGDLAAQFHDAGLLDELHVTYAPVALGAGAPLFPRHLAYPELELVSVNSYGGVFVQVRYRVVRGSP